MIDGSLYCRIQHTFCSQAMRDPCTFVGTFSTFLTALLFVTSSALTTCDVPVIPANNTYSTSRYPREAITLSCKPSSNDNIEWFFRSRNQTALDPFPFSWCHNQSKGPLCKLYDSNTSLNIEMISKEADGGFICVASCSATGRNTSATITLSVEDCFASVPELIPTQNVSVSLMQTATLTCRAHVGKCYQGGSLYVWRKEQKLEDNKKYKIEEKQEGDDLVTTLTIRDVTMEDLTSYQCILIDDKFVEGHRKSTVFLIEKETMTVNVASTTSVLVLSVLLPLLIVVVFIGIVFRFCRWHIKYKFRKGNKAERGVNDVYDALLYKDDDHAVEAKGLRDKLESLMYKVCTPEDSHTGGELQSLQDLIDCSASVILFCNDDDKYIDTILSKAQENQSVFVIRTKKESRKISRLHDNKSMAAFVELCWPSHRSSIICVRWLQDEFYYRLRVGLPKSRLEQISQSNGHTGNKSRMNTDIVLWENETNKI